MVKTKVIIHISDAKVSNDTSDVLMTYSLGSCIAVCLYDPVMKVGGMLHYQLPDSKVDSQRARKKPCMFADTGMKLLIEKMQSLGGDKNKMIVKIAGGAEMDTELKGFDIGKRNYLAIRKILWKNGMIIKAEDTGGKLPRNMYVDIANGDVIIRLNGIENNL